MSTSLQISEGGGALEFVIAVLNGTLRFDVPVDFATANDTALGSSLYFYAIVTSEF